MTTRHITIQYHDLTYRVGYTWSHPVKAVTNCDPDKCHPAEGGMEEITEIEVKTKHGGWHLDGDILDRLANSPEFNAVVVEAIYAE